MVDLEHVATKKHAACLDGVRGSNEARSQHEVGARQAETESKRGRFYDS